MTNLPEERDVEMLEELEITVSLIEKDTGDKVRALLMNPADVEANINEGLLRRWCERRGIKLVMHAAISAGQYMFAASVPEELQSKIAVVDPTAHFTPKLPRSVQ
jgi:hypothetical protein